MVGEKGGGERKRETCAKVSQGEKYIYKLISLLISTWVGMIEWVEGM